MEITINGKSIELKQTIRSLLMFENIQGTSYQPKSLNDILLYLYCVVVASSKDYSFSYEDWIDWVDENPAELEKIVKFIQQTEQNQNDVKKKSQLKEKSKK